MTKEQNGKPKPKPKSIPEEPAQPSKRELARLRKLQALYSTAYADLQAAIYEAEPQSYPQDAESILCLLAEALPTFQGPINEQTFQAWATEFVQHQAHRYAETVRIVTTTRRYIRAAIRKAIPYDIFDRAFVSDTPTHSAKGKKLAPWDLEQEAAIRVFTTVEKLAVSGPTDTAKQSTRVYALTERHTIDYFVKKWRRRSELLQTRVQQGLPPYVDIEVLPEGEYKSQKYLKEAA